MGGLEVVQRRGKGKSACNEDILNFDAELKHRIMASEGCKPPYWSSISSLPQCWKMEQMKAITSKIYDAMQFDDEIRPCRVLENLQFNMMDVDSKERLNIVDNQTKVPLAISHLSVVDRSNHKGPDEEIMQLLIRQVLLIILTT